MLFPSCSSLPSLPPQGCYKLRNVVVAAAAVVYSRGSGIAPPRRKSKGRQRQIPSIRDAVKKVTIESPMPREGKKKAAMEGKRGFSIMPTGNEGKMLIYIACLTSEPATPEPASRRHVMNDATSHQKHLQAGIELEHRGRKEGRFSPQVSVRFSSTRQRVTFSDSQASDLSFPSPLRSSDGGGKLGLPLR